MVRHYTDLEKQILKTMEWLRMVTRILLTLYFFGLEKRVKWLETLLPKLEREGKLEVVWHNGKKVYSLKRKNRARVSNIDHELGWVEVLIRLWRCRMAETEIVPEKAFRRFGIVPECGLRFSKKEGNNASY